MNKLKETLNKIQRARIKKEQELIQELAFKWIKLRNRPEDGLEEFEKIAEDVHKRYVKENGDIKGDEDLLSYYKFSSKDMIEKIKDLENELS